MKYLLVFCLCLLAVGLLSCSREYPETDPAIMSGESTPPAAEAAGILSITDTSGELGLTFPVADEIFFDDENHWYYFDIPKSRYILITYSDGSSINLRDAMLKQAVSPDDLDAFGIVYYTRAKHISVIIDHTARDVLPSDDVIEPFYQDEEYRYSFPTRRSDTVIVYYKDGTTQPVREALARGKAIIRDLDQFGIHYLREPLDSSPDVR